MVEWKPFGIIVPDETVVGIIAAFFADEINGIPTFVLVANCGFIFGSHNEARQAPPRWKRNTAIPSISYQKVTLFSRRRGGTVCVKLMIVRITVLNELEDDESVLPFNF